MSQFRAVWDIEPTLPDGHVIGVSLGEQTTASGLPILRLTFLESHVGPELVNDMNELFRHVSRSPQWMAYYPERLGEENDHDCRFRTRCH